MTTAERTAREARDHPVLDRLARAGMVAYGAVYLLVGWLAAQLALGNGGGSASGEGALEELAQQPTGAALLWAVAVGLCGLVLRQALQAVGGHQDDEGIRRWGKRGASLLRGATYAVLTVLAVRTALGNTGDPAGRGGGGGATGELMRMPLGPALVVGAGLVAFVLAGSSAWRGLSDRWEKDLHVGGRTGAAGKVITVLARTGYVARAVAFAMIGGLFVWAGLTHDPKKSGGLDQAIVRFRDEPYGPWVFVLVAAGLACYGGYHVARGYYLRNR